MFHRDRAENASYISLDIEVLIDKASSNSIPATSKPGRTSSKGKIEGSSNGQIEVLLGALSPRHTGEEIPTCYRTRGPERIVWTDEFMGVSNQKIDRMNRPYPRTRVRAWISGCGFRKLKRSAFCLIDLIGSFKRYKKDLRRELMTKKLVRKSSTNLDADWLKNGGSKFEVRQPS